MNRNSVLVALSGVALALLIAVPVYFVQPPVTTRPGPNPLITITTIPGSYASELATFTSYTELRAFIDAKMKAGFGYPIWLARGDVVALPGAGGPRTITAPTTTAESSGPSYSSTNVQVAGVDEADVVKTDGAYLYLVSSNRILIVKAYPPEEATLVTRIDVPEFIHGLFVNGDRLILLLGGPFALPQDCFDCVAPSVVGREIAPIYWTENTTLRVYDIADRAAPSVLRELSVMGYYSTARMVGDYVYAVVVAPAVVPVRETMEVAIPTVSVDGEVADVPATDIYYTNATDSGSTYTTVVALNTQDAQEEPNVSTIVTGATSTVYVSPRNIYLTMTDWQPVILTPEVTTAEPIMEPPEERTLIHRLEIAGRDVRPMATGAVPGHVLNQFSMDEWEGHFRIATTTFSPEGSGRNHLYVLGLSLDVEGQVVDMAPGETIYSVRFMGDRAYVVTFRKIDPLFVIDVSDPSAPTILGQLKTPGYSTYMHPFDATHLIGIGKDAVPSDQADFAWYQGVKLSLFDVSDVSQPKELFTFVLGDRGTESPVLYDHKALLFDRERGLLVMPVLLAVIDADKYPGGVDPSTYGDFVFQGAYVFDVSLEQGIQARGRVTHLPDDGDLTKSGYYFDSTYEVRRSLYIGDVLYTLSDRRIVMNNLQTLELVGAVELPATST